MGKPWVGPILSEPIFKIILSLSALNYILSLKKENPLEITFSKASKIMYHILDSHFQHGSFLASSEASGYL